MSAKNRETERHELVTRGASWLAMLFCMRSLVWLPLVFCVGCGAGAKFDGSVDAGPDSPFSTGDSSTDAPFDPDSACVSAAQIADPKPLPVDIIWMIDNSSSMAPAVAEVNNGLNAFASLIDGKSLDYRVIMLSIRNKTSPITVGGATRYPICVPPPLAGDSDCGNGPRFFHSSIDVRSTQTFEQFLGTLGQTPGFAQGQALGGEPWQGWLRPEATKTILVVTDDNARLTAQEFETFSGGPNPFNSTTLPPGILDPSWNGIFDGYIFGGVYGWGDPKNPSVRCTYPNNSQPTSGGSTYTTLVTKTNGPRAKVCDGAPAWTPFFNEVAQAVLANAKISCEMAVPDPGGGQNVDPSKVNVTLDDNGTITQLTRTAGKGTCGADLSWYFDDDTLPTKVLLCPAACTTAQSIVGVQKKGAVKVLFGCASVVK
ncbi:hypothetical protein BH09MYX1_BH09MYX1_16600 [soil metagenome]